MEKRGNIVGWYCWIDYIQESIPAIKGKVLQTDDYGVILQTENDKQIFVPWCQIKQIVKRD